MATMTDNGRVVMMERAPLRRKGRDGTVWPPKSGNGAERVTITPDMAEAWLERRCAHQRPVSQNNIRGLTSQITAGKWCFDGSSIVFDTNGQLIDGQHRCIAVVEANRPIESMVIWGVEPEAYLTKDTGKSRSAADILNIENAKVLATVARALLSMELWGEPYHGGSRSKIISNADVVNKVETDPKVREAVAWVMASPERKSIGPAALTALCYYLTHRVHQSDAAIFWESIATGGNIPPNDARLVFLRYIRNAKMASYTHSSRRAWAGCAIKAWNAWRGHESVKLLRQGIADEFPVPC